MTARIKTIAAAVVDVLNAASLSQAFTAVRAYSPEYTRQELATLRVTVVAKAVTSSPLSRRDNRHDYQIDVAIHKLLDAVNLDNIDPYMLLAEEIAELLADTRLDCGAVPIGPAVNDPIYSPEHLKEKKTFLSLITVTYRQVAAKGG